MSSNIFGKVFVIFCVVRVTGCLNKLNVTRCPDPDVNTVEWKQYDKACQDKNPTYKFHCQQDNTGSVTTLHSYCAVPEQCLAGYYPFINGNTAECQRCSKGTYQTNGKISYEYKHPSCDENWSKPNPGEIECRSGSTTENRRFKCNWMDGYIPDSNRTTCLCFSHDDVCSCYKKPCEDGKERNGNYTCVPSTNTSTSTSMKPPTNTSLKPPTTSNKTPDWVPPVAIVLPTIAIAAIVILFIVLYFRRRKRKKRDERCQDKDEEGTDEALIPDELKETKNKDTNESLIKHEQQEEIENKGTDEALIPDELKETTNKDTNESLIKHEQQEEIENKDRRYTEKKVPEDQDSDQTAIKTTDVDKGSGITHIGHIITIHYNDTKHTEIKAEGGIGVIGLQKQSGPVTANMPTDARKTEINAHTVGNMATGDNHSGNQTATMPAGSENDSSKETSPS